MRTASPLTTRCPANGVWATTVPMVEVGWEMGEGVAGVAWGEVAGVVAVVGDVATVGEGAGGVARLRSSALTMWRPAAAARAAAPARERPVSEGMTKAS